MSEIAKPATKEIATQVVPITAHISGELFTSALSEGYARKGMIVYNSSDPVSGETYVGEEGVTPADGMILEKGEYINLPMGKDLPVYFVGDGISGEELRVLEWA